MGVDSDISPRQPCLFTRPVHYTDNTYLEQIDKEPHPFTGQAMGDISGIAILFRRAINYILSGDQIYEGTCERLWKSQLAGI